MKIGQKKFTFRDFFAVFSLAIAMLLTTMFVLTVHRTATIYIVNVTKTPIAVTIDGRTVKVFENAPGVIVVRKGVYVATAKIGERIIERAVIQADPKVDAVVYNVLGAAPIALVDVVYSPRAGLGGKDDDNVERHVEFLAGKKTLLVEHADYVLKEPPKSISTSDKSKSDIRKRLLTIAPGGWKMTAGYLRSQEEFASLLTLSEGIWQTDPASAELTSFKAQVNEQYWGHGAHLNVFARQLRVAPDLNVARGVLSVACEMKACEVGERLLSGALAMDPIERKLALTRLLPETDARKAVEDLAAEHSGNLRVLEAAAWLAYTDGRWDECARLYEKTSGSPDAVYDVEERAACLFAAGKKLDALQVASRVADVEGNAQSLAAITYARIALLANAATPFQFMKKDEDDHPLVAYAAQGLATATLKASGETPPPGPIADATAIARAAISGPHSLKKAWDSHTMGQEMVPAELMVVMGAELARLGEFETARNVFEHAYRFSLTSESVFGYVIHGIVPRQLYRIDPGYRAALDFIRGRRLQQLGQNGKPFYDSARRHDPLEGWVTRLMTTWSPPQDNDSVVAFTSRTPQAVLAALPEAKPRKL